MAPATGTEKNLKTQYINIIIIYMLCRYSCMYVYNKSSALFQNMVHYI